MADMDNPIYVVKDMGPGVNGYWEIVNTGKPKEDPLHRVESFICNRTDADLLAARLNAAYERGKCDGLQLAVDKFKERAE